jgi:hypothetical protein
MQIVVQIELSSVARKCALTVNLAVNGESGMPTVDREHLCGTSSGSQEHHLLIEGSQGTDNGTSERGLSRTGTSAQYHDGMRVTVGHERGKGVQSLFLFRCGRETELAVYLIYQFVANHYS